MDLHERIFDLKYNQGISTFELLRRFPRNKKAVREVALAGVSARTLRASVKNKKTLKRLITLQKKLKLASRGISKKKPKKPWFIWW